MYNASRASRPIRALNGDFSFNARVLTNRAALASRPFVVVADRFDSKGTGESVGGCCSPTNWFGRSLAWARLRTRVNAVYVRVGRIHIHTLFLRPAQTPACVSAPRVRTGCLLVEEIISNWIQDLKIGRSWMELFKFALVKFKLYSNEDTRKII